MNYTDIRKAVLAGALDDDLTQLAADVRARKEAIAAKRALDARLTLRPGATVTVNGLRPSYINGLSATVVQVNKTRAVIKFNDAQAAGRFGSNEVTVPLANITLVDDSGATDTPAAPTTSTNQRMREGAPVDVPDYGRDWPAEQKWLEQYLKDYDVIRFQIADGYAFYEVRGNTLHHIPVGDAYQAHPALIRGLTKREVDEMLERDRRMNELFAKRSKTQGPASQSA